MSKSATIDIRVTPEHRAAVVREAEARGMSVSAFLRHTISEYLKATSTPE